MAVSLSWNARSCGLSSSTWSVTSSTSSAAPGTRGHMPRFESSMINSGFSSSPTAWLSTTRWRSSSRTTAPTVSRCSTTREITCVRLAGKEVRGRLFSSHFKFLHSQQLPYWRRADGLWGDLHRRQPQQLQPDRVQPGGTAPGRPGEQGGGRYI